MSATPSSHFQALFGTCFVTACLSHIATKWSIMKADEVEVRLAAVEGQLRAAAQQIEDLYARVDKLAAGSNDGKVEKCNSVVM